MSVGFVVGLRTITQEICKLVVQLPVTIQFTKWKKYVQLYHEDIIQANDDIILWIMRNSIFKPSSSNRRTRSICSIFSFYPSTRCCWPSKFINNLRNWLRAFAVSEFFLIAMVTPIQNIISVAFCFWIMLTDWHRDQLVKNNFLDQSLSEIICCGENSPLLTTSSLTNRITRNFAWNVNAINISIESTFII